jgi:hypothetical protein
MGLVATFPQQGMQISRNRKAAMPGAVALPWGGQTGVGSAYSAGAALTLVGGPAQAETWILAASGVGTLQLQFVAGGDTLSSGFFNPATTTGTLLLGALNNIWPSWVLPAGSVVGGAGGPWTITFGGSAGYNGAGNFSRIGGNVLFNTTGSVVPTLTRSQRGSCGAGQYDYADGVTNLVCNAFLIDTIPLGPTGTIATIPYGANTDQTDSLWAWVEGFFFTNTYNSVLGAYVLNSPNLTDAIVAASPRLSYYIGTTIETPGAEVRLLQ